jgi:hypothetical protein
MFDSNDWTETDKEDTTPHRYRELFVKAIYGNNCCLQ